MEGGTDDADTDADTNAPINLIVHNTDTIPEFEEDIHRHPTLNTEYTRKPQDSPMQDSQQPHCLLALGTHLLTLGTNLRGSPGTPSSHQLP